MNKEWAEKHFTYDPETGVVRRRKVTRGEGIGWIDDLGYVRFYVEGYCYRAHNIAWVLMTGDWMEVDHRDCEDGKRYNLGRYMTIEEAKAVYDKKAVELFGEFARL